MGTWYFSVTAGQGANSPILPGGKRKKEFFLTPAKVMFETVIVSALYFSVLLLIDFQSGFPPPHFLALLKFCSIQIGFTKGLFSSVHSIIFSLGTLLTFSEVLEVLLHFHISDIHSQPCVLVSSGRTKFAKQNVDGSLEDSDWSISH